MIAATAARRVRKVRKRRHCRVVYGTQLIT